MALLSNITGIKIKPQIILLMDTDSGSLSHRLNVCTIFSRLLRDLKLKVAPMSFRQMFACCILCLVLCGLKMYLLFMNIVDAASIHAMF